ncbi:Kelch motif family protein [Tritrichomonas foetus]|uniref:Kelch motif family protein n=1 Tax=Tritrichomonas foetus TaxID=1144522 RepID=A0A1J4L623_9EUKA|nr:Kelch motif family protein [Tritrichomonas foetus]|eukprot:OHT17398.1 Kelch motif family protein [Tritrichomonas foetus]
MGATHSDHSELIIHDIYDVNVRLGYGRMSAVTDDKMLIKPITKCKSVYNKSHFIPPFSGIWSIDRTIGESPKARMNHFTITSSIQTPGVSSSSSHAGKDEKVDYAYIGCGIDKDGNLLNDLWKFDLKSYEWEKILTHGDSFSNRRGVSATLFLDYIVVFGGYNGKDYLNDIFTINIQNGYIQAIKTTGDTPDPRCNAFLAIHNMKLFVWGGHSDDNKKPTDLSILDLNTKEWTRKNLNIGGRTMIPLVQVNNFIFSYGGSKMESMIRIDLDNEKSELLQGRGSPPLADVVGASMIKVDDCLFYFGGQNKSNWTLMYAYCIKRNWWFVFFIRPDGETVTYKDGKFNKISLFLIPRLHSFSMTYSPYKREIVGFLGYPFHDPKSIFKVNVTEALSFCHLRDDMLQLF